MSAANLITMKQVKAAARACVSATQARRQAETAETEKTVALMAVMEPLLGIKTADELKVLSLEEVKKRAQQRLREGIVKLRDIAANELLERMIQLSQERRNVSWGDEFLTALGESRKPFCEVF